MGLSTRGSSISELSTEHLERALRGRFGRTHRLLEVTRSTNSDALSWAEQGAPEGALVVAERQTQGRGTSGRTWVSHGGDLLFSVVLRPNRPAGEMGLLTTAAGVSVAEAVEETTGIVCGLKWPNDVIVGARKLCGILVESYVRDRVATVAVCGVGLNVSARPADLPPDAGARPTSLVEQGAHPDRAVLLATVLARLEELYPHACDPGAREGVLARAVRRSTVLGRTLRVRAADGRVVTGRATALMASGGLEIDGRVVTSGSVEWIA